MIPAKEQEIVARETLPSYELVSVRHGDEVVHRITVTGPISLERRLPLYEATLAINRSSNYFCILDNSGGHENDLSFRDMQLLDQKLLDGGIRCFYGATITDDKAYAQIVELASATMSALKLTGKILSTGDRATAEQFIAEKLRATAETAALSDAPD